MYGQCFRMSDCERRAGSAAVFLKVESVSLNALAVAIPRKHSRIEGVRRNR